MNRNENLSPELIKARETIVAMKQEFADKMATQVANITDGTFGDNGSPMRMDYFASKMNALNKILELFDMGEECVKFFYEYCQDDIEALYNDIRNGGNLCFLEGLANLRNAVEKYAREMEKSELTIDSLTSCKTYYQAILDGKYIDFVIANLKDCRAELVEQVEMLDEDNRAVDEAMEMHGMQGYLNSCNLLISALETRRVGVLLEHEKEIDTFYAAMKEIFANHEDILEACKFAVKIFMRENQAAETILRQTSYAIKNLQSKEDVLECLEETATKIKELVLDDWYVEDAADLIDMKEELHGLFLVIDYLKALII